MQDIKKPEDTLDLEHQPNEPQNKDLNSTQFIDDGAIVDLFSNSLAKLNYPDYVFKDPRGMYRPCEVALLDQCSDINLFINYIYRKTLDGMDNILIQSDKHTVCTQTLIAFIETQGKFIVDEMNANHNDGIYFMHGHRVISIFSDVFKREYFVPSLLQRVPKDHIIDCIAFKARNFPKVKIYKNFFYNEDKNVLYFSDRLTGYYRITPLSIDHCLNGDDDIYFLYRDEYEFVTPDQNTPLSLLTYLQKFSYDALILSSNEYIAFLYAHFLTVCFESIIKSKPLLIITGEKGSGKTTLAREFLKFLVSKESDVLKLSKSNEEELDVIVTNNNFCVLDNVESCPEFLQDSLAIISTSGKKVKRKLYTTNETVEYKYNCFLTLTAINPTFRRPDIIDRLILISLQRLTTFVPDEEISLFSDSLILKQYYGQFFIDLQKILHLLPSQPRSGQFRLASYFRIITCALTIQGLTPDQIDQITTKLNQAQQSYLMEGNLILNTVLDILEGRAVEKGSHVPIIFEKEMSGKQLLEIMIAAGLPTTYTSRKILGELRNLQSNLRELGIEFETLVIGGNARKYNLYRTADLQRSQMDRFLKKS